MSRGGPVIPRRTACLAGLVATLQLSGMAARADDAQAEMPIAALLAGLLVAMKSGRTRPFRDRFNALAPSVDGAFDLPAVLRSSVGPRFDTLPPDEQAQLLAAFRAFTISSYVSSFNNWSGERLEIVPGQRSVGESLVVRTVIQPAQGEAVPIDYVMQRTPAGWRAVDVLLNGSVSQNAVKRSDFRSLVTGGSALPLIQMLRRRVSDMSGGSVS